MSIHILEFKCSAGRFDTPKTPCWLSRPFQTEAQKLFKTYKTITARNKCKRESPTGGHPHASIQHIPLAFTLFLFLPFYLKKQYAIMRGKRVIEM